MESLEPVSARVHAILARESNRAVVFRRGPSDQVAVIGWDRGNDTFLPGQWFHGRIYEYRCDLTPDGKHLLYFAADYARRKEDEDSGAESRFTSWTAISRAPYLKALALWWNGTGWNGGGLFRSNREFWLNRPPERIAETVPERSSREFREVPPPPEFQEEFGWGSPGECPMVYFPRLERDGWRLIKTVNEAGFFYENPCPADSASSRSSAATGHANGPDTASIMKTTNCAAKAANFCSTRPAGAGPITMRAGSGSSSPKTAQSGRFLRTGRIPRRSGSAISTT